MTVSNIKDFHTHGVAIVEFVETGMDEGLDVIDFSQGALTVDLFWRLPHDCQARFPRMKDVSDLIKYDDDRKVIEPTEKCARVWRAYQSFCDGLIG